MYNLNIIGKGREPFSGTKLTSLKYLQETNNSLLSLNKINVCKVLVFFVGSRAVKVKSEEVDTDMEKVFDIDETKTKDCRESSGMRQAKREELTKHHYNLKIILQSSNATPIRCYGGIGYACCYCSEQFPDPADLKKHTADNHLVVSKPSFTKKGLTEYLVKIDITDLCCKLCNTDVDTLENLMDHLTSIHNKNLFKDIKNYILPFKFDSDVLRCYMCLNIFTKFKKFQEHMGSHYRNFVCEVCDSGFVNERQLLTHKECHDLGTFNCSFCSKVFDTDRKKKMHEKSVHSFMANRLNRCGYCNETFKSFHAKERHLVAVHGVPALRIKCQACDKTFTNRRMFTVHTKRDHLMERPHKCPECDMGFSNSTILKNHMLTHTGLRMFKCEVCLKAYARKKTLREHMRIHNNDRRFKCEHCGQAFVQKCSLKGHLRSKHGTVV